VAASAFGRLATGYYLAGLQPATLRQTVAAVLAPGASRRLSAGAQYPRFPPSAHTDGADRHGSGFTRFVTAQRAGVRGGRLGSTFPALRSAPTKKRAPPDAL